MRRKMKQWVSDLIQCEKKTPIPILSFPCIQLLGVSVSETTIYCYEEPEMVPTVMEKVTRSAFRKCRL